MKGYAQFCPLALASEIVGERWTPLILRELMLGARHFNDIRRGVPRISSALLSLRLRTLEKAGIIERRTVGRTQYTLTEAGMELVPTIKSLANWGKRWLPATLSDDNADPDLIMWDMHRRFNCRLLPHARTVIQFEFTDQPQAKRLRWILIAAEEAELCITDPGLEPDLFVVTDSHTLTWVWYGDIELSQAIRDGAVELHGPPHLCAAFPSWLQLSQLADVARKRPARDLKEGRPAGGYRYRVPFP